MQETNTLAYFATVIIYGRKMLMKLPPGVFYDFIGAEVADAVEAEAIDEANAGTFQNLGKIVTRGSVL